MPHIYAIAIGSNRALSRLRGPGQMVGQAIAALGQPPFRLIARSPIITSAPIGPSRRRYSNTAVLVETAYDPPALLAALKGMERAAGRRSGQRWAARTLDLDIILWSGGCWSDGALTVPHSAFRQRDFVLRPLAQIAPRWRDPITGLSIRQLMFRIKKPKPVDRGPAPD